MFTRLVTPGTGLRFVHATGNLSFTLALVVKAIDTGIINVW